MDDVSFESFLLEQRESLADLERIISEWRTDVDVPHDPDALAKASYRHPLERDKSLRDRFDTVCRRLADAYMIGSQQQRESLRAFLCTMPGVRATMGIPFTEIRLRMDETRFRLALIYESMKDLGDDSRAAITALDNLCRAARIAGINPDPSLQEVAAVSNETDHAGVGSMQFLLLDRTRAGGARIRCPVCGNRHAASMTCPVCAGNDTIWPSKDGVAPVEDLQGAPDNYHVDDDSPALLPLYKLLGFTILFTSCIILLLQVLVALLILFAGAPLDDRTIVRNVIAAVVIVTLLCIFRFDRMVRRQRTKGYFYLEARIWQLPLLAMAFFATVAVFCWFIAG